MRMSLNLVVVIFKDASVFERTASTGRSCSKLHCHLEHQHTFNAVWLVVSVVFHIRYSLYHSQVGWQWRHSMIMTSEQIPDRDCPAFHRDWNLDYSFDEKGPDKSQRLEVFKIMKLYANEWDTELNNQKFCHFLRQDCHIRVPGTCYVKHKCRDANEVGERKGGPDSVQRM